jgi:lysylphosphatidylglycerol synthetase-like protein (DUF2156 family)
MKTSFKGYYAKIVLNRYFLVAANTMLILIIVSSVIELTKLLLTPENDIKEMLKICHGISIILYGYGVAMETRRSLLTHLNIYPLYDSRLQQLMDSECHKYGIFTLLLGLAMEILVHLMIIPNRVLNTEGKESYIFAVCLTILIFVLWLQLSFSYKLIRLTGTATEQEDVPSFIEETRKS